MITLRILDPKKGDSSSLITEEEAAERILEEKKKGRAAFAKWDDNEILELMTKTGIASQLKEKDELVQELQNHDGQTLTLIPPVAGG